MEIVKADRIKNLPPYLFAAIDKMREEAVKKGMDIINLSIGDPDLPTPPHIIERLKEAASDPRNHRYPSYEGMLEFRTAVARWYKERFAVELDPEKEVVTLIGSKEGIAHIPLAFVNPGDLVLIPDPGYPVYSVATSFAGGQPYVMPLLKENKFLPDFSGIPEAVLQKAKLMFINYPNNPTAACAERPFMEEAVKLAERYGIIICHDAAYTEVCFNGYKPMSILEVDGAKNLAIEFHSLSKTYNMTGWRIGFATGNANLVGGLGQVKTNVDSGAFQAVQIAGIEALQGDQSHVEEMRKIYQERRDIAVSGLKKIGFEVEKPQATFYLWVSVPRGFTSSDFTMHLLTKAGIVTTPGNGFGRHGEGYIRIALTVDKERLSQAVRRMSSLGW
jgi:LL-diaminopimelate aminotransferase